MHPKIGLGRRTKGASFRAFEKAHAAEILPSSFSLLRTVVLFFSRTVVVDEEPPEGRRAAPGKYVDGLERVPLGTVPLV